MIFLPVLRDGHLMSETATGQNQLYAACTLEIDGTVYINKWRGYYTLEEIDRSQIVRNYVLVDNNDGFSIMEIK